MPAFHGDLERKTDLIERLKAVSFAGELMPGFSFGDENAGELAACLCKDSRRAGLNEVTLELGIPEWFSLVYLTLFGLSGDSTAQAWAIACLEAIPAGADLEPLMHHLFADLITDPAIGLAKFFRPLP